MAIYTKGILGEFSGSIGNVVGSSWKRIPVIKSRPVKKITEPSLLQKQQQAKFALLNHFLHPLTELFNQTYKQSALRMTGFNRAMSENRHVVTGDYPALAIDYSRVLLSRGRLPLGEPPMVSSREASHIHLFWKTGDGIPMNLTSGSVYIATYCEELGRWIYILETITSGKTSCELDLLPFSGKSVQVWIGFISRGNRGMSQSRYMGSMTIS